MAASTIACGVGKSGSPAPNPITGRPAARMALALASTASVADSAIAPILAETRGCPVAVICDAGMTCMVADPCGIRTRQYRGSASASRCRTLAGLGRDDALAESWEGVVRLHRGAAPVRGG